MIHIPKMILFMKIIVIIFKYILSTYLIMIFLNFPDNTQIFIAQFSVLYFFGPKTTIYVNCDF